jgi:hypothetical protein
MGCITHLIALHGDHNERYGCPALMPDRACGPGVGIR